LQSNLRNRVGGKRITSINPPDEDIDESNYRTTNTKHKLIPFPSNDGSQLSKFHSSQNHTKYEPTSS